MRRSWAGPSAWTPTVSPISEVLLAGSRLVDHDLARLRPRPLDERQRVERRVALRDAEAEIRRAAVHDHLAVVSDELRLAVDASLRLRDARHGAHLREQRFVEGRRRRARLVGQVERRLAADDGVRALADVREDRVEGLVDRVREDERAADHRDAEHDGDRGQARPQLTAEQPLERERRSPEVELFHHRGARRVHPCGRGRGRSAHRRGRECGRRSPQRAPRA